MFRKILIASMLMLLSTGSQAELFDRGGGMIYDDVLNITWLQDANLGGDMNWFDSVAWAAGLSYGGFDDWRLASTNVDMVAPIVYCGSGNVSEVACRDNELNYMHFYNLMGNIGDDLSGNQGLFTNIPRNSWSGTTYAPDTSQAYVQRFRNGQVGTNRKFTTIMGAWAVRDGDVISDTDADGVADSVDNCTVVANADQRDTDGDGYGNICDPDLNNDGTVNFADLTLWVPFFNTATSGDADFNGDGFANFADFGLIPDYFLQPPGPSGVAP